MICKKCGQNVQDGVAFCPACGENLAEAQQPAPAPAPAPAQTKTAQPLSGWKKIVNKIGIGAALAVAAFALIFLFFVGIQMTAEVMGMTESEAGKGGVFYYFHILENIIKIFETNPNPQLDDILVQLISSIFGMIVTLALIIVTLIFAIITIVKGIKALAKGEENNYLKFAGIVFAVFFVLSVAYGAISSYSMESSYSTMTVGLNGAGVTGIILCGIFLLGAIGCKIAIDLKSYISVKAIMGIVGTGVKVISILLMLCFLTYAFSVSTNGASSNYSMIQALGLIPLFETLSDQQATALGAVIIGIMFLAFMFIIMISNVINASHELSTMKTQISLKMPISTVVFALIYMIVSIIAVNSVNELIKAEYTATFPIVVFVLSLVNLAGAIVRNVGAKKLA